MNVTINANCLGRTVLQEGMGSVGAQISSGSTVSGHAIPEAEEGDTLLTH